MQQVTGVSWTPVKTEQDMEMHWHSKKLWLKKETSFFLWKFGGEDTTGWTKKWRKFETLVICPDWRFLQKQANFRPHLLSPKNVWPNLSQTDRKVKGQLKITEGRCTFSQIRSEILNRSEIKLRRNSCKRKADKGKILGINHHYKG